MSGTIDLRPEDLRGYVDYLRDLGVYDLYQRVDGSTDEALLLWFSALQAASRDPEVRSRSASRAAIKASVLHATAASVAQPSPFERSAQRGLPPAALPLTAGSLRSTNAQINIAPPTVQVSAEAMQHVASATSLVHTGAETEAEEETANLFPGETMAPLAFNLLAPVPTVRFASAERAAALQAVRNDIGDCTRCPLAYSGRHTIVFGDGDPNTRLLFVGEGPGADEDESGMPFVGKAGQLLNNMIGAMGLQRSAVYIANVVKCRPPKNRTPEPIEANTCSQFLLRQIDIVQPEVIVALGATAATYLLGVKQSLSSLRGRWFDVRGAKCAVTYHPAYLLRDPRQKTEAWKDLQRVMVELKLRQPTRE